MTKPDAVKGSYKLIGKSGEIRIMKLSNNDLGYVIITKIFNGFYWMPKVFYHYEQVTQFLKELE